MSASIDTLFDPPGPQGARRDRTGSVLAVVAIVAIAAVVIQRFAATGGLDAPKWVIFTAPGVRRLFGQALVSTLQAAATAGVLALLLGVILALLRFSRSRAVRGIVTGYVEVTRSLPTLLVLYFTVLFLPYYGVRMPVYWQLVIALVVTNAALISEIVRAALLSIPKGQTEASLSLGLTRGRALRLVVLPQALTAASPALVAQVVYLLKGTTLGYVISYEELLHNGRVVGEYTGNLLQSFLVVTAIFLLVNLVLSRAALILQKRLAARGVTAARPIAGVAAE